MHRYRNSCRSLKQNCYVIFITWRSMSWCLKTRCLGDSCDSFHFFRVSFFQEWEKASKREEGESCRGGIVAVCLPSAGNELVKEKSKWFIGRKEGNRGREDSEKERKRLGVIGESLCLFVFSLFLFFTTSHLSFPRCPFVKHSTTTTPLHPPHTFASSSCLHPTPIVSSYIDSFEVYFCPPFVHSLSRDLPLSPLCVPHSHRPAIFLSTRVSMAATKYFTPLFNSRSFALSAHKFWDSSKKMLIGRGKYSLFNIPFTH